MIRGRRARLRKNVARNDTARVNNDENEAENDNDNDNDVAGRDTTSR